MTLLSVVVPVYKVQGYLRACLDSILDQGFDDLEVVAVDDRSPDSSGGILAEYEARDPRVRVLSLPRNVGLGRARNAGLAAATGEYVWFLDSDDWLTDGAVAAVAERLRRATPDVLIVNHQRAFWTGRFRASSMPPGYADMPEPRSVRECPWLLGIVHVAWNKIVRRQLLLDRGLTFDTGWYEDVSFTFPLLVTAERISVLDRVCVNYRQRRVGAITRTVGERHFEVFTHWERAFELIERAGPPATDMWPTVFGRMIWHFLIVMGNGNRVPRRLRRAFFHRAADEYARYFPPGGYPVPGGVQGVKHHLLARRAWRTFALLWSVMRLRRAVQRRAPVPVAAVRHAVGVVRSGPRGWRAALGRLYYRAARVLPLDDQLAVYAAYWYRGYACNPAAIYAKARELAPDVRGVWVVRRDRRSSVPHGVPYVVAGSLAYYRALARAKYLINNVNFPNHLEKRRGSIHLQTHHGSPVKVMGVEEATAPGGNPDRVPALLRRCDRWDFSLTSNALSSEAWERMYPCRYETLEYGYPRNDRLVRADDAEVARARAAVGAGGEELVVLYMPTHRNHDPGYVPPFDAATLAAVLGPRGRLLVRSHYFNEPAGTPGAGTPVERVIDVSTEPSVEDLYLAADVLVTDYSSAMFDYATLDRPLVIYAPDWAEYRRARGVTFDLLGFPPGVVATTFARLLEVFESGAYAAAEADAARAAFRERFCAWDDGNAAERVVRRVFLGEKVRGRPSAAYADRGRSALESA